MKRIFRFATPFVLGASATVPLLAFAQSGINLGAITPYSNGIINVINSILVPVLIAIAFITFLWGVFKYFIYGADDEGERATGRQFVLWGVIGFVVIISLWGLVYITMTALGLGIGNAPPFPTIGNTTGVTQTSAFPSAGQGQQNVNTGFGATNGGGAAGTSCTGSGQSTCASGLTCVTTGEGYNTCQSSSGGTSSSGGGTAGASCTGSGQSTCASGLTCQTVGEGYNACEPASAGTSPASPGGTSSGASTP